VRGGTGGGGFKWEGQKFRTRRGWKGELAVTRRIVSILSSGREKEGDAGPNHGRVRISRGKGEFR